nr:sulfite exporter TauE/SafE family protein [Colwellia maritima]
MSQALTYIVGQNEKLAIASSLAIVGLIALTGAIKYQLNNKIQWDTAWQFGLPSMLASYTSAGFSVYLTGTQQIILFAIIMLVAALSMFKHKINVVENAGETTFSFKLVLAGLAVGAISGLVGVGGGFLIIPALLAFTSISMTNAVATSLVIITLQSLTGFINYYALAEAQNLIFDWKIIAIVAGVGSLSSLLGERVSTKFSQQKLKRIFAVFLLIMSLFILIKSNISFLLQ